MIVPTEAQEQARLFALCNAMLWKYPELRLLHHVPNGGSRNTAEAANLRRQGVKPGVCDIFLPVARKGFHGLYIELKRQKGGRLSAAQREYILDVRNQGYAAFVCRGADAAMRIIIGYLNTKGDNGT